jgi:hypothetical protein
VIPKPFPGVDGYSFPAAHVVYEICVARAQFESATVGWYQALEIVADQSPPEDFPAGIGVNRVS